MILSKVMKQEDYKEFEYELYIVKDIAEKCGGWPIVQHMHRQWEYSMVVKVLSEWIMKYPKHFMDGGFKIADVGGGIGFTTPILMAHGCDVVMYEPWLHGNEEQKFLEQVNNFRKYLRYQAEVQVINRGLNDPVKDIDKFEAAFCISTLEHIANYQGAFLDLLKMVKPQGLVFLTTDFADNEVDNYAHAGLRVGRMFTERIYNELITIGNQNGFSLLNGEKDYNWSEECRMVNDYGFASLAMVRQ